MWLCVREVRQAGSLMLVPETSTSLRLARVAHRVRFLEKGEEEMLCMGGVGLGLVAKE